MRLEILVDAEEPKIFPLNKPKILIGSSETCDIVLPGDGISRKHLIINVEGDRFFVTDQGSSNGSFINEERLVPGRKSEFTSFFPVRLGTKVLITLLSDDESSNSLLRDLNFPKPETSKNDESSKTRVVSLKELKNTKTADLVKKRDQARNQKNKLGPNKKNSDSQKMNLIYLLAFLIFGGAAFYQFYLREEEVAEIVVAPDPAPTPEVVEPVTPKAEPKILPEEMPSEEMIKEALNQLKCTSTLEEKICNNYSESRNAPAGVYESIGRLMIFAPQRNNYQKTFEYFPDGSDINKPSIFPLNEGERTNFMIMLFISNILTPELFNDLKEKNIFIIFFELKNNEFQILNKVGIKGSGAEHFVGQFSTKLKGPIKSEGYKAFEELSKSVMIINVSPMSPPEPTPSPTTDTSIPATGPVEAAPPVPNQN